MLLLWQKIKDYILTAFGGLLTGILGNEFLKSLLLQLFGYHEGWYRRFLYFLLIPAVVLGRRDNPSKFDGGADGTEVLHQFQLG
jgi:hypothetical protein